MRIQDFQHAHKALLGRYLIFGICHYRKVYAYDNRKLLNALLIVNFC